MHIAVLGTGSVGTALANKLLELGHSVTLGSGSANSEGAINWLAQVDPMHAGRADAASFAQAAEHGELVINATPGAATLAILADGAGAGLSGKVLLDLANPLDFSRGFPPRLSVCNDDSLGEQIQRAYPDALVVKSLNTLNNQVMINPERLTGRHVIFVAGNDAEAKTTVVGILGEFGWAPDQVIDLGDITAARATEMYMPLWLRLMGALDTADFNIEITR